MSYQIELTNRAEKQLAKIQASDRKAYATISAAIDLLAENPSNPKLVSKQFKTLGCWESRLTNIGKAYRALWDYMPGEIIQIRDIGPHVK